MGLTAGPKLVVIMSGKVGTANPRVVEFVYTTCQICVASLITLYLYLTMEKVTFIFPYLKICLVY